MPSAFVVRIICPSDKECEERAPIGSSRTVSRQRRFHRIPLQMASPFDFAADAGHVPGWLTRAEGMSLFAAARHVGARQAIVEIGSFKGRSTLCLAKGARAGQSAWVFAIDPHRGNPEHQRQFGPIDTYMEFTRNLEAGGVADLVAGVRDESASVASRFKGHVGLLFVDGNHAFRAVREDLRSWLPLVVDGGLIGVHDSWQIWGPHLATARELLWSRQVRRPRLVGTITYFQKTRSNTARERWQNRAFVLWRLFWGFKGFLSLKLTGTLVRRQPIPGVRHAPSGMTASALFRG